MLTIKYQATFKKDYNRVKKRGYNIKQLEEVIRILSEERTLPAKFKDHMLSGNYSKCHECHIAPDWLLIYEIKQQELILYLMRTGTHSDLF